MKDPSARQFIEVLEKESLYRLTNNFKEKYFEFLDTLFAE